MRVACAIAATFLIAGCATRLTPPEANQRVGTTPAVQLPRPGTEWVYEGGVAGRPDTRRRQVVQVKDANPKAIVETHHLPDGRTFEATHRAGAYVAGRGFPGVFAFSPYLPVFERVTEGDSWRGLPFRGLGPCNENPNWTCTFDAQVTGTERVVVAAGAFETLRIEIDQKVTTARPTGRFRWHVQRKATFWYAPVAKRFVKASWRTVAGDWRGPDREAELVSYTPN